MEPHNRAKERLHLIYSDRESLGGFTCCPILVRRKANLSMYIYKCMVSVLKINMWKHAYNIIVKLIRVGQSHNLGRRNNLCLHTVAYLKLCIVRLTTVAMCETGLP